MLPSRLVIISLPLILLLVINIPTIVIGQEAYLYHDIIKVAAGKYVYVDIDVTKDTIVKIWAYITVPGGYTGDIDISIIRPDGSLELVETRYTGEFQYKFKATMSGTYKLKLDNTYSVITTKIIDLAIVADPPPHTVTITRTTTLTETRTITETSTYITTVEKPIEKTTTVTETITTTETTTLTTPTTIIQEVPTTDWTKAILIAIVALVVGFIIAWFTKTGQKT